jgi:hypothetical protein
MSGHLPGEPFYNSHVPVESLIPVGNEERLIRRARLDLGDLLAQNHDPFEDLPHEAPLFSGSTAQEQTSGVAQVARYALGINDADDPARRGADTCRSSCLDRPTEAQ